MKNLTLKFIDKDKYGDEIVLWGNGNTFFYYEKTLSYEGIKVKYIVDSINYEKKYINYKVYHPSILSKENCVVLIMTTNPNTYNSIIKCVLDINPKIKYFLFDEYILRKNIYTIQKISNFFEDNYSKDVYYNVINSRISCSDIPDSIISAKSFRYDDGRYFQEARLEDVIIDAGAFVGDTLEKFIFNHEGTFKKYYAFEPDFRNFHGLNLRKKRLIDEWCLADDAIITIPKCCSNVTGDVMFRSWIKSGVGSSMCHEIEPFDSFVSKVQSIRLDDFVMDSPVTFIKADIEGAEFDMLKGARDTISRYKPRLAISVYHNPSDLYRIPMFIKELNIGYKFQFRHYSYGWGDSILYCF